jgi:hypothetical protein
MGETYTTRMLRIEDTPFQKYRAGQTTKDKGLKFNKDNLERLGLHEIHQAAVPGICDPKFHLG